MKYFCKTIFTAAVLFVCFFSEAFAKFQSDDGYDLDIKIDVGIRLYREMHPIQQEITDIDCDIEALRTPFQERIHAVYQENAAINERIGILRARMKDLHGQRIQEIEKATLDILHSTTEYVDSQRELQNILAKEDYKEAARKGRKAYDDVFRLKDSTESHTEEDHHTRAEGSSLYITENQHEGEDHAAAISLNPIDTVDYRYGVWKLRVQIGQITDRLSPEIKAVSCRICQKFDQIKLDLQEAKKRLKAAFNANNIIIQGIQKEEEGATDLLRARREELKKELAKIVDPTDVRAEILYLNDLENDAAARQAIDTASE